MSTDETFGGTLRRGFTRIEPGTIEPACRACGASLMSHHQHHAAWAHAEPLGLCHHRGGCLALYTDTVKAIAEAAIGDGVPALGAARLAEIWAEAMVAERALRHAPSKRLLPKKAS